MKALTRLSRNWRIERMAVVERNIIRLALWELLARARRARERGHQRGHRTRESGFGTAEGAAFVNGLLDRAVTELEIPAVTVERLAAARRARALGSSGAR